MGGDGLLRAVQGALSDDLRRAPWKGSSNPFAGHCYVASEALYHLMGGSRSGFSPTFVRHEDAPHWFLRGKDGRVLDPTAGQFRTPVPYSKGVGKGFLTKAPSRRAQVVIDRVRV